MKRAIVISGGGSKGAFAVGALEHLVMERNLTFDIITGTSTGALMAPLVATGRAADILDLIDIYTSVTTEDIIRRKDIDNILRSNSIFDTTPLLHIIRGEITEQRFQDIVASGKQMIVTTVCLQTGEVVYFQTGPSVVADGARVEPIRTREEMIQAVLASSNQPVFMRPVQIPQGGATIRQYADGGVREIAPLRVAVDNGATEIYAIVLTPEKRKPRDERFQSVVPILLRAIGLFTEDVVYNDIETARLYNDAILYMEALKARIGQKFNLSASALNDLFQISDRPNPFKGKGLVTLKVIRPERELPTEGLEFDRGVMATMMEMGSRRAAAVLGN
jgi:predicted acylesterase/phospholipase RssA